MPSTSTNKASKTLEVAIPKIGAGNPDVLVAAFRVPAELDVRFTTEIVWSDRARACLGRIAQALTSKVNMPVAPLRFALETVEAPRRHVEDALYRFRETVAWYDFGDDPAASRQGVENVTMRVSMWLENTLLAFLRERKVDAPLLDDLRSVIASGDILSIRSLSPEAGRKSFPATRSVVYDMIAAAVAGKTVFPDLGPLMRRHGTALATKLELVTQPMEFPKGKVRYLGSLVLRFEMKQLHGTGSALVLVTGGRIAWGTTAPTDYRFNAELLFPGEGRSHVVSFGRAEDTLDTATQFPSYLQAYSTFGKTTIERSDVGTATGNSVRLLRPLNGRARKLGRGLPYYDLSAAITTVRPEMLAAGFDLFAPVGPRPSAKGAFGFEDSRPSFGSKKLGMFLDAANGLLGPAQMDFFLKERADFLKEELIGHFGVEVVGGKDLDGKGIDPADVARWHAVPDRVGVEKRKIAILSRDERDRDMVRQFTRFYLGRREEDIVVMLLPAGVHGVMPPADAKASSETERFDTRCRAWSATVADLRRAGVTDVLVIAARDYDGQPEDRVNKLAAKHMFATADIGCQYLVPRQPEEQEDKKANDVHLQRVQSAIRDLFFGQRGFVDLPRDFRERLTANGFGAKFVYGISIALHNRKSGRGEKQKPSASVLICTRLDTETGLIDAVTFDGQGAPQDAAWRPYATAHRKVATTRSQRILGGGTQEAKKTAAQPAIRRILDMISAQTPDAIVYVDPSSGKLNALWPWLQVPNIRKQAYVDHPDTANDAWDGLTVVCVDDRIAPTMMAGGSKRDNFYSFTEVVEQVELERDFGIWWYQATNRTTNQSARTSCYQKDREGRDPLPGDADFMMPRPIQLTVRSPKLDGTSGHFLVALFKQLRSHHMTYADESTYPSPLFEHARLKKDMCRLVGNGKEIEFYLEEEDAVDD